MPYNAKSIDFDNVLNDVVSKTKFLDDPGRLLELIKEDCGATAKVMQEIGIDLERVIDDFYIKKVPIPEQKPEELPPEKIVSEELLEKVEAEAEEKAKEEKETVILSHEEIKYLQEVFDRRVLTVAGLPEKEISKIIEALTDEGYLSTKGIHQNLSDRLTPLLSSPVVRAVDKLSKSDVAQIRELLSRRTPTKEEEEDAKEVSKEKVEEAPKKPESPKIVDYNTLIDIVVDESKLTNEAILETIGYESEVVYEIMTKLLHISPEKVGKDLLGMRTKDQVESYIDGALKQLDKGSFGGFLGILKPRHPMMYDLMQRLEIGLREALEALHANNQTNYNAFVDKLFMLYGHMLKPEVLRGMVFGDPVIASGIINQCGLKQAELIEIVKAHDEIGLEIETLFKNYNLNYEPFKEIKYKQIEGASEELRKEVQEKLKGDEQKVEFLYGIYDVGLNYELQAKKHNFCMIIVQYANKSSANPYEIALRLGDKLKIPLPENFLRDMALSLAMSLKRAELVSEERFNELLEKANRYRQEEGYYEIAKERKNLISLDI